MNAKSQLPLDDPELVKKFNDFVGGREVIGGLSFELYDEMDLFGQGIPSSEFEEVASNVGDPSLGVFPILKYLHGAHREDSESLRLLIKLARSLCHELELLHAKKPEFVEQFSREFNDWPLLIAPKDGGRGFSESRIGQLLSKLEIGGTHAFRPSNPHQRYDETNLWTKYANAAIGCMRTNRNLMPELLAKCTDPSPLELGIQNGDTVFKCSYYGEGEQVIEIKEWQRQCVDLPQTLTKKNYKEFMRSAKLAIREYWCLHPKEFTKIAKEFSLNPRVLSAGQTMDEALKSIAQAMEGLGHKAS